MGRPLLPHLNAAVEMYDRGLSIGDIASVFGVTRQSIWDSLKRRGTAFRPKIRNGDANRFYRGGRTAEKRAGQAVQLAVGRGIIQRRTACESCGSCRFIEGHHDDYNKPLMVRWLCHKCHFEWHRTNKAVAADDPVSLYTNRRWVMIEFQGRRQNLTAWARERGFNPATLKGRLERGWSVEKALLEPVR